MFPLIYACVSIILCKRQLYYNSLHYHMLSMLPTIDNTPGQQNPGSKGPLSKIPSREG